MEGRVCLYNCSYSSRSLPTLGEILELDCACQEDTNLENFFTEHLVYMGGTLFWGSKFHSQVWHILMWIYYIKDVDIISILEQEYDA